MSFLSTATTLGGAVVLRIMETCRLLCTTFWALSLIIFVPGVLYADIRIRTICLLAFATLTFLLSRSSMVRKDYSYITSLEKLSACLVYFASKALCVFVIMLFAVFATYVVQSLSSHQNLVSLLCALLFALLACVPIIYGTLGFAVWIYVLLDSNITFSALPQVLIRSLRQTHQLIYHNITLLLTFTTVVAVVGGIFSFVFLFLSLIFGNNLFLRIALQFIILAPAYAVFYEEARYRTQI